MHTKERERQDDIDLAAEWGRLRADGVRIRAAAERLGASEAELLERTDTYEVTPLRPDFSGLFHAFERVGEVMASTRNPWAVIEKHGTFRNVDVGERMGIVLDEEIDLRLFVWNFARAYAVVNPEHRRGPLRSVQFFDASGTSLHKVYLQGEEGAELGFDELVEEFRRDDAEPFVAQADEASEEPALPAEEELEKFRAGWRDLEDTHDFFGLLREYGLTRRQAMEQAPEGFAVRAEAGDIPRMLELARDREVPIMCFVGNRGCIEIHTGPVHKIVATGDWINVLDPRFNLHLDLSGVEEVWRVIKPTVDGVVTSLELLAADGSIVAQFFGERKPGKTELTQWRELVADIVG